jgi:hypothetical protein
MGSIYEFVKEQRDSYYASVYGTMLAKQVATEMTASAHAAQEQGGALAPSMDHRKHRGGCAMARRVRSKEGTGASRKEGRRSH